MNGGGMIRIMSWICMIFAVSGSFWARGPAVAWSAEAPGLYTMSCGRGIGSPDTVHYGYLCTGTLSAYVGLPVDWEPQARCVGGGWGLSRAEIATGALPPGLTINAKAHIVGIPERAGTWHLQVRFVNVTCAGTSYGDKTQDLHITTEGSSAPKSVP